jgi:hypothetical protein
MGQRLRLGVTSRLRRFAQLLEETEHFCGCGQEKVAKIVHCGEKIEEEAIRKGGLKFFRLLFSDRYRPITDTTSVSLREWEDS